MQNQDQRRHPARGQPSEQREQQGLANVVQEQQHEQQPEQQQLQQREEEPFQQYREGQVTAVDVPSQSLIQNPKQ